MKNTTYQYKNLNEICWKTLSKNHSVGEVFTLQYPSGQYEEYQFVDTGDIIGKTQGGDLFSIVFQGKEDKYTNYIVCCGGDTKDISGNYNWEDTSIKYNW